VPHYEQATKVDKCPFDCLILFSYPQPKGRKIEGYNFNEKEVWLILAQKSPHVTLVIPLFYFYGYLQIQTIPAMD